MWFELLKGLCKLGLALLLITFIVLILLDVWIPTMSQLGLGILFLLLHNLGGDK